MDTPKMPFYPVQGCVFKLFWGEKYVIVKCKFYARAKTLIEKSLHFHFKTGMQDKLYEKFFDHIKENPNHQFEVKILFQSDNPYQLLKQEQVELDQAKQDKNCMNVRFEAYYPKGIQGKEKFWINRGHFLNFKHWLKQTRDG